MNHETEDGLIRAIEDLRRAEARLARRRLASRSLSELDLTAIRIVVDAASEGRELTPTEIAETLQVSSASITAVLRRLEDAGYADLRANPADRRSKFVVATEAGRSLDDPVADSVTRAAVDLTEAERMVVAAFLCRVTEEIDAALQPELSRG
ncbi:MarR family transcriptional regulator [Microbacterium oryzae]|uniref:MarR family winged helix-turn-helix transcriptional regulator n=1 Tax=Microbacterium oryzae TaxID=743009 RepID=UPI0025B27A2A|nr:MarR family transcriptional regulator [Microbacterium oryzae]MDN3310435.1 MarR family transcriptional regulator [Microbacterium oryzae]